MCGKIICHKEQSVTGEKICYGPQPMLIKEHCIVKGRHKLQSWHTTAAVFFENKKRCFSLCDGFRGKSPPICSLTSLNQNSYLLAKKIYLALGGFGELKEFIACAAAHSASGSITHKWASCSPPATIPKTQPQAKSEICWDSINSMI